MKSFLIFIMLILLFSQNEMIGQSYDCSVCDSLKYSQNVTDSILFNHSGVKDIFDRISAQNDSTKGLMIYISEHENGFSKCYIIIPLDDNTNVSACQTLCKTYSGPTDQKVPVLMIVPISKNE